MNTNKLYGLSEDELKDSILRLAYFDPNVADGGGNKIIDHLIIESLTNSSNLFAASILDLKNFINRFFKIEFEEAELYQAIKRLAKSGKVSVEEPDKRDIYSLKIKILEDAEIENRLKRERLVKLEERVVSDWKQEVLFKYSGGNVDLEEDVENIILAMRIFVSKMFIRHGVDSVSLLFPNNSKALKWFDSVEKDLVNSIPTFGKSLDSIIRIEIPEFLKSNSIERREYLTNLFNASFYWHLIQIDNSGANILKSVTTGQQLVLDANIVFNLVGIGGSDLLDASHRLLKLADELGYDLLITTKTIDEFQNSLKWQMREYGMRLPVSSHLAKIAVDTLGVSNFVTAYWNDLAKRKVSIEEFVSYKSYLTELLGGLNISITNKYREDIENSEDLVEEMSLLRKACGSHFNEHIVEHDAYHRIFIKKLRKGNKYNFKDAKAWFLTQDSKLPVYSRVARRGQDYLPFCITTNQWIQLNRPFLSRTKSKSDFEDSLINLLTQPYLRSFIPNHPLQEAYGRVLGRLSRYENLPVGNCG